MCDVIVIGMGPAGMNAALYAKRSGLNVLMLEKNTPGGLIATTSLVENYLGFESVTGSELAYDMFMHTQKAEIPYRIEEVENIIDEGDKKIVITTEATYETKAIIICGGRQARRPDIPNIEELEGKGVSYCAVCDGPLYKDKVVGVIGAGNSAFEESLYLSEHAKEVYIFVRSEKIRADQVLQDKVKEKGNIKVLLNSIVKEVETDNDLLKSVTLENGEVIELSGLFIYIGYIPTTRYLENLNVLDEEGYIKVDEHMRSEVPYIYAAGDIVKKSLYQIVTASSEGAIAATSARKDLTK